MTTYGYDNPDEENLQNIINEQRRLLESLEKLKRNVTQEKKPKKKPSNLPHLVVSNLFSITLAMQNYSNIFLKVVSPHYAFRTKLLTENQKNGNIDFIINNDSCEYTDKATNIKMCNIYSGLAVGALLCNSPEHCLQFAEKARQNALTLLSTRTYSTATGFYLLGISLFLCGRIDESRYFLRLCIDLCRDFQTELLETENTETRDVLDLLIIALGTKSMLSPVRMIEFCKILQKIGTPRANIMALGVYVDYALASFKQKMTVQRSTLAPITINEQEKIALGECLHKIDCMEHLLLEKITNANALFLCTYNTVIYNSRAIIYWALQDFSNSLKCADISIKNYLKFMDLLPYTWTLASTIDVSFRCILTIGCKEDLDSALQIVDKLPTANSLPANLQNLFVALHDKNRQYKYEELLEK